MYNVSIICIGKLKENYLRSACAEYEKRLGAFCKLKIIELNPTKLSKNPSEGEINTVLEDESNKIISKIPNNAAIFPMCIEGKMMSSEAFSKEIEKCTFEGHGNICFIIGGSHGLSEKVKSKAKTRISMSPMTFPHQLARVILLEQIYRAFMISSGAKYHK